MAALGAQIELVGKNTITAFRRLHGVAILINLAQLAPMVWSLIFVTRQ